MRRSVALAILLGAVLVGVTAGCGGEETVTPAPETVVVTLATPPPPAPPEELPAGDPAVGKETFDKAGCGACHTFAAAGSSGTIGPNLDDRLAADAEKAGQELDPFTQQSIVDPDAVVADGFQPGIMPGNFGDQLSDQNLADLVAFLTQGS